MRRGVDIAFLIALGVVLIVPACFALLGVEGSSNCENRALASQPELAASSSYIDSLESYYKDHFFGRKQSVEANSKLKWTLFNSSSKTDKAVIGEEDWLFYSSLNDNEWESTTHNDLLTPYYLNLQVNDYEARYKTLREQGIAYYVACWPNKSTGLRPKLPTRYKNQLIPSYSKAEQLDKELQSRNANVQLLRVDSSLVQQREGLPLYLKNDTHWNDLGAFKAYQKLMLHMGFAPYQLADFDLNWDKSATGDLLAVLGICASEKHTELVPRLTPKPPLRNQDRVEKGQGGRLYVTNKNAASDRKLLVFRDSYTSALIPFLSLHFREVIYVGLKYRQDIVDEEKPSIVLSANVERYL